jgi:hypothetical protein
VSTDETSFAGRRLSSNRADAAYQRYPPFSDNQLTSFPPSFGDKESPYSVPGKPLMAMDSVGSPYQQQQHQEEALYQNVRRTSREDYGGAMNGKTD